MLWHRELRDAEGSKTEQEETEGAGFGKLSQFLCAFVSSVFSVLLKNTQRIRAHEPIKTELPPGGQVVMIGFATKFFPVARFLTQEQLRE